MPPKRPAVDRFAEKIALTDSGCIEWIASIQGAGYGQFTRGRPSRLVHGKVAAHRWSYEYHVGPIPDGMHIDHLCRNRCAAQVPSQEEGGLNHEY